jgi:raffinose/stachyose/melibiose transport system permease protein
LTSTTLNRRRRRDQEAEHHAGGLGRTPFSYVWLILLALFAVLPVLVLLFNSVKGRLELGQNPLGFPRTLEWSNFSTAWEQGHLGQGLLNSAILVSSTILGVWICAGMASYALARLDVPFKTGIATYLFLIISLYIATNTPFATLLLRTFLVGIPRELDESARIDGANEWQTATRIILPLARPGFLTVGLVVGLATYNELLFAVTFISDPEKLPIATAYLSFSQGQTQRYELLNAAGVIMIIPVIVLFLFMQRRFISGLATGGVKG